MKTFYKILGGTSLFLAFAVTASAATLSLSPTNKTVNVGDTFTISVLLNTAGQSIDGVDLKSLNYNPYNLQVINPNNGIASNQIQAGVLMPNTLANSVDTVNGKIVFSQVTNGGSKYNGSGTLATVTFKTLVAGTVSPTFNFTSGATTDSNVASGGVDILTGVTNGQYIINNVSGTVTGTTQAGGAGALGAGTLAGGVSSGVGGNAGYSSCVSGQTPTPLVRNLFRGLKGEDVRTLQTFLVNQGYTTQDNITGFFGPITEATVKKFQKANSIVSSGTPLSTGYGSVGPKTKAKINAVLATSSCASSQGSSSTNIQTLQAQIEALQKQVQDLMLKLQKSQ